MSHLGVWMVDSSRLFSRLRVLLLRLKFWLSRSRAMSMSRFRLTAVYMMSYSEEVVLVVMALEAEPALASQNSVPF